MAGSGDRDVLAIMAERRLVCERAIPIQQKKIDSLFTFSRTRFDSAKSEAQRTIQLQEKLGKLKGELLEAEEGLVKALSVKTKKEAKRMAMMESISAMKARFQELNGLVEDQRKRKDEYSAIMFQQFEALTAHKEKCTQNREHMEQIEEAISWYNRILGFRIEPGCGVKFIFTNINRDNPDEEYSFITRHENDIYTLLNCVPHLSDTKEMVNELNKTNGLFKFVRTMREVSRIGSTWLGISHRSSLDQDTSINSISAPVSSVSTNHSYESPRSENLLQLAEPNTSSRKVAKRQSIHTPQSSARRRSARLKGKN
ncbi:hypothetical protein CASFOL_027921 [Castilleja foliolosa]|uniref:Kinetochore protein SPC25 n=1 Tax=Castilleja foliolosa TaxID=1961234 RepID=A0ABD3CG65_9LAMI